jgi:hypothetical protein
MEHIELVVDLGAGRVYLLEFVSIDTLVFLVLLKLRT